MLSLRFTPLGSVSPQLPKEPGAPIKHGAERKTSPCRGLHRRSFIARCLLPMYGYGIALLWGCRSSLPPAYVSCPSPEPPSCIAFPWQGAAKDTTPRSDKPYWKIAPVEGLCEPGIDEIALFRLPDGTAWVTLQQGDRQWIASAMLATPTRAHLQTAWNTGEFSRFGFPTGSPNLLFLAGQPADTPDVYLASAQLRGSELREVSTLSWNIPKSQWISQPTLSPDGSVLVFAADFPDSYGGTDLYFAVRLPNGAWKGPYNCGPQINSACHELTPAFSPDGRWLLFASNGHTNVGGYDLFASPVHPAFWQWIRQGMPALPSDVSLPQPWFGEAENLGIPFNSPNDELSPLALGAPDSLLYWSSNRRGDFDLYFAQRFEPLATPLSPAPPRTIELQGQVREQETQRPLPGAEVRAHPLADPAPIARTTTDSTGSYRLRVPANTELELIAQAGEVFFEIRRIRTGSADTALPPLELPARFFLRLNFPFDRYDQPYPFVLDTNGMESPLHWQQALDLLAENILRYRDQLQQLLLVGHTDDIGSAEYNRWLGRKRVEFVINELIRRGVPRELLRGESAGQSQLLPRASNESPEQWRKRCRRVELTKVLRTP